MTNKRAETTRGEGGEKRETSLNCITFDERDILLYCSTKKKRTLFFQFDRKARHSLPSFFQLIRYFHRSPLLLLSSFHLPSRVIAYVRLLLSFSKFDHSLTSTLRHEKRFSLSRSPVRFRFFLFVSIIINLFFKKNLKRTFFSVIR